MAKANVFPEYLKDMLRKRHNMAIQSKALDAKIETWFRKNGLNDLDYFRAMEEDCIAGTEALTNIEYGEGEVDDCIFELEEAYIELKSKKGGAQ
jgi:hypothetical protein